MKNILLASLLLIYTAGISAGSFRHLTVNDGLSSRQVFQINQDPEGFIWAFTPVGIDRYDGNEIRHYKLDETLEARNHILSATVMAVDLSGVVWVALNNGKIYHYDRTTDSFLLWKDLNDSLPAPVILHDILFSDETHILLCLSTGIYSIDRENKELTLTGLAGEYVYRIVKAANKTYYAGTNKHVYLLQPDKNSTGLINKAINLPFETRIEALHCDGTRLYIGTFSDGAYMYDLNSGKATFLDFIPNVPIRTFSSTRNGSLLIATDGAGLYEIDANNNLLNRYITNEDDEMSLGGNTVADVYVDERNCIWVGTYTHGISYMNSEKHDIRWIKHEKRNANSLLSNHVNVIFEDSAGDLWYGTNDGVSLYQPKADKWSHFLNDEGNDTGYSAVVLAISEDNRGRIWAGGYGIGVYLIDKKSGNVQKMKHRQQGANAGIGTDYIYSIHSEENFVWLGGIEGEMTRYDTQTGEYTYYPFDCIGDIKPGKGNTLILAGCYGLAILDKSTGEAVWHRTFAGNTLRYPIRCLLQSSTTNDIWMATDGEGLIRFNPDTEYSEIYGTANGLVSNAINSLVEDNSGRIWFNTEKELYCLDVRNDKIISINEAMGINWGFYNPNSGRKLSDGSLSFGTAEGVLNFVPFIDSNEKETVKLLFTDFKLLYQSIKAGAEGSLLERSIDKTQKVKLSYLQNSFSISFSAINFNRPYKIRYEYMLQNFSDEWENTNTIDNIDYMNLSPGRYIFRLKAINKYTSEKLDERELEIIIGKPVWASWWAIMIYIVISGTLVFLILQYVRQRINDYNTQEKIRTFINIAHDIRTPITLIKAPLTELRNRDELPEETRKSLNIATKNAEKLFSMVTRLLDLQKAELHPEKLKLMQHDIGKYMEDKIADFQMTAQQKGLELILEVPAEMPEVWFDREKMNNIMDNLLSNAIKYTSEGYVRVTVGYSGNKWFIRIKDTGIGIPEQEQKNLFHKFYRAGNAIHSGETGSGIGLMLTRRIIRLHHGKISFRSTENEGTTFTVTFPVKLKKGLAHTKETIKESEYQEIPAAEQKELISTPTGKNVLLLAEDNDDMREYLTDRLSAEYEVISVTDGGKALQMAREINPDIIISDVIMPVLQGDELCRILKSSIETSHIPIILLTALNERENVIQGLEAGANDYIIKPFDFSVLKVRLRNILQNRQHLRERVLSAETDLNEIDYSSQLDKEFLDKVMEIIHTEIANPDFSVNDFCRLLSMSRTSIYYKVKTLTDQSPNDFIRIIRLNKGRELLQTRRHSVSEVSYMVGFSDPKYFSTCFKKQFGISPSKI